MFLDFFYLLKANGLPVSLHEQLSLMEALKQGVAGKKCRRFLLPVSYRNGKRGTSLRSI